MALYGDYIGREQVLAEQLTGEICQRFAVTMGHQLPTREAISFGARAPLEAYLLICLPVPEETTLGADGLPLVEDFLPPINLPRRVWGGSRLTIGRGFRVGDKVTRRGQIKDIYEKHGRSGRMLFIELDFLYEVGDALCLREELRLIYLEERSGEELPPTAHAAEKLAPGEFCFTPHQMFRFAALTFNAHRIHFDADYARRKEGYLDMVVQGPLMTCAVLADLRKTIGANIAQIDLRAHGVAYVNEPLHIVAPNTHERSLCNRSGEILVHAKVG